MAGLLYNNLFRRPRRPNRERIFRHLPSRLDTYSDNELRSRYRFGRVGIQHIVDLLDEQLKHETQRNHALSSTTQVLIALRFFASGSFYEVIGDTFGVHKCTVSRSVLKVATLLCRHINTYIIK